MAGLDGVENKIHPGEAATKDLYHLPPEEGREDPDRLPQPRPGAGLPGQGPRLPDQGAACSPTPTSTPTSSSRCKRSRVSAWLRIRSSSTCTTRCDGSGQHPFCGRSTIRDGLRGPFFVARRVVRQSPVMLHPSCFCDFGPTAAGCGRRPGLSVTAAPPPVLGTDQPLRRGPTRVDRTIEGHAHHRGAGGARSGARQPTGVRAVAARMHASMPTGEVPRHRRRRHPGGRAEDRSWRLLGCQKPSSTTAEPERRAMSATTSAPADRVAGDSRPTASRLEGDIAGIRRAQTALPLAVAKEPLATGAMTEIPPIQQELALRPAGHHGGGRRCRRRLPVANMALENAGPGSRALIVGTRLRDMFTEPYASPKRWTAWRQLVCRQQPL